jgi:hypothetical protein
MDIVMGKMYLFVERVPLRTHILLRKEMAKGRKVLYLTKNSPLVLKSQLEDVDDQLEIKWLSPRPNEECLSPVNLVALEDSITHFMEKNPDGIIVLNGLEVLEMWNGFTPVAACLKKAQTRLAENNNSIMISVDPKNLFTGNITPLTRISDEVISSTP